jgi:hypothetical protein
MSYYITTFCYGAKYDPVKNKWMERIKNKCKNGVVSIVTDFDSRLIQKYTYAWWDSVRLQSNLNIVVKQNKPVVHIDLDLIIEKDIEPIINLNYDIIISKEIGDDEAFPKECSKILGFGVCSGFYVIKPSSFRFMMKILKLMKTNVYNSCSDQVNIMNYIVNNEYKMRDEEVTLDGIKYTNKIITVDNIKICVLDFNIIIRDPIINIGQFGNHINIHNVGGTYNFLKYFDQDLETLPLTCRCGKVYLGDNSICKHIELRKPRL